jgi:hypothetical protein
MCRYGSCGLSAPQVGVPLSVIMVEFSEKINGEYSPEIRKAREMAIVPFKVSPSVDSLPSVHHSNIYLHSSSGAHVERGNISFYQKDDN